MLGKTALPSVAGLDLEAVDEVDHVGRHRHRQDQSGHRNRQKLHPSRCPWASTSNWKSSRSFKRQLGDGELIFDRTGLILVDLGIKQVADNARFVLALDGSRHD